MRGERFAAADAPYDRIEAVGPSTRIEGDLIGGELRFRYAPPASLPDLRSIPPAIRAEYDAALLRQVERQPQRRGPLLRWARRVRRPRQAPWRPRWLLGLVEITEYPRLVHYWCVPGYPASCGFPARQPILIPLRGRP